MPAVRPHDNLACGDCCSQNLKATLMNRAAIIGKKHMDLDRHGFIDILICGKPEASRPKTRSLKTGKQNNFLQLGARVAKRADLDVLED